MSNDILKSFIIKQTEVAIDELTDETLLERDLGVYGDDGVDLIVAFGKEFNVDISNFMAADYFSPEGDLIFSTISNLFNRKTEKNQKELTLKHLEKAIVAGRLDEEVINS